MRRALVGIGLCLVVACLGLTLLLTFNTDPAVKLSDIPLYPGAQSVTPKQSYGGYESPTGSDVWKGISFEVADKPQAVLAYYEHWFTNNGWQLAGTLDKDNRIFRKTLRARPRLEGTSFSLLTLHIPWFRVRWEQPTYVFGIQVGPSVPGGTYVLIAQ